MNLQFLTIGRISTRCILKEVLKGTEFSSEILLGRKVASKHFYVINVAQFYLKIALIHASSFQATQYLGVAGYAHEITHTHRTSAANSWGSPSPRRPAGPNALVHGSFPMQGAPLPARLQ